MEALYIGDPLRGRVGRSLHRQHLRNAAPVHHKLVGAPLDVSVAVSAEVDEGGDELAEQPCDEELELADGRGAVLGNTFFVTSCIQLRLKNI